MPPASPVLPLGALALCVLGSYGLARPSTESLFLSACGPRLQPWAWLCLAVLVVVTVRAYNQLAARLPLLHLALGVLGASAAALLVLLWLVPRPAAVFALELWKELYIVLLVEIFWSAANLLSEPGAARWSYGLYCFLGSVAGMSGNLASAALAGPLGSRGVLAGVLPLLGGAALSLGWLARRGGAALREPPPPVASPRGSGLGGGLAVLRRSRYLVPLLGMVAAVQVTLNLIDYRFKVVVAAAVPDVDRRTAVMGQVYAAIDLSAIALQGLTGPLLRGLGLPGALTVIPAALAACVLYGVAAPGVLALGVGKVAGKALDYSVLRAAKEQLYLPLPYVEKVEGKALIDILTYRVAKGGASLLLLVLPVSVGLSPLLSLAFIGAWLALARVIARRYPGVQQA